MLKQLYNEAEWTIRLTSQTPLLINGGMSQRFDVDMSPVLTHRRESSEPYIPGSSAKGVLRSHAERIARTLSGGATAVGSCDPFAKNGATISCSERLKEVRGNARVAYSGACPICRIFGCTSLQSRAAVSDFYAIETGDQANTEKRDGVGIDRFTGGSSNGALFSFEVAVGGKYTGTLKIVNFELWQLGALAFVLRDLCDGALTFGMGKSRGLGQMKGEIVSARVRQFGRSATGDLLTGLAALGEGFADYGFSSDPREREGMAAGVAGKSDAAGISRVYEYAGTEGANTLLRAVAPLWPAYISARVAAAAGGGRGR